MLESDLMDKPPLYFKLWTWILLRAEWRTGKKLQRGQFLTSIAEMREAMSWLVGYRRMKPSKDEIRSAYEALTKATMITTVKTTRGMIISVLNYDIYQDPKNYEGHSEAHDESCTKPEACPHDSKELLRMKKGILGGEGKTFSPLSAAPEAGAPDAVENQPGKITQIMPVGVSPCPATEIIKTYHDILPELPGVRTWTGTRLKHMQTRWKEDEDRQSLDWWRSYFESIRSMPHLMGNNDRAWKADLEWLVNPTNMGKVLNGRYVGRAPTASPAMLTRQGEKNLAAAQAWLEDENRRTG